MRKSNIYLVLVLQLYSLLAFRYSPDCDRKFPVWQATNGCLDLPSHGGVFILEETPTDRHTDRQTNGQTQRQTDR
jgi:hypothetical protein